jgi:hypothetical protein
MRTQENPTFSYHSILVWNQWYPQHQLPGTEHVSDLGRGQQQQQAPAQKRHRRTKRGNKSAKKGQQQQQIVGGRNDMDLDKLSCYIVSLRNDINDSKMRGKTAEKTF